MTILSQLVIKEYRRVPGETTQPMKKMALFSIIFAIKVERKNILREGVV